MARSPQAKLKRSIAEFRYKPELKHLGLLPGLAEKISGFPNWMKRGESLFLRDYSRRCHIGVLPGRFFYGQDSGAVDVDTAVVDSLVETAGMLDIKEFRRFGIRRKYLNSVEMEFHELVKLCQLKFYNKDLEQLKVLPSRLDDLVFRLDMSDHDLKFHITVAPMRKAEIAGQLEIDVEQHFDPSTASKELEKIEREYPDVALFMDLDIYSEARPILGKGPAAFLIEARKQVEELATELSKWVLE